MAGERISIDKFLEAKLLTATVRQAERVAGATRLLRLVIDCGDHERQLVAGIGEAYAPEELVGKRIVIVANLEPAKIRGVESQGMLLAAQDSTGKLALVTPDREVANGATVR